MSYIEKLACNVKIGDVICIRKGTEVHQIGPVASISLHDDVYMFMITTRQFRRHYKNDMVMISQSQKMSIL